MTNVQLASDYLAWLRDSRERSPSTLYGYAIVLDMYMDWLAATSFERATLGTMEEFIARPRGGRAKGAPGAAATRAREVAVLKSLYRYLVGRGVIDRDPTALLSAPKVANTNPRPVSDDDWCRLWAADLAPDERVAYGLGMFTGLRRSEVMALMPLQVFPPGGRLVSFKRKGGGADTTPYADMCEVLASGLPMLRSAEFPELLASYVEKRLGEERLMPWADKPQAFNRLLGDRCVAEGLPHLTPHMLRHGTATNLLRCGVPLHLVQRLLNHSSPATTMRYVRAGASELREWLNRGSL